MANLWCERKYQASTHLATGRIDYTSGHHSEVRFEASVTAALEQARLIVSFDANYTLNNIDNTY
jgi:hypothetical protein